MREMHKWGKGKKNNGLIKSIEFEERFKCCVAEKERRREQPGK